MKKILLFLITVVVAVSCVDRQKKAKKLVKEALFTYLDDFESYDPISFGEVDSLWSDWTTSPDIKSLELAKAKMERKKDSLLAVRDKRIAMNLPISGEMLYEYLEASMFPQFYKEKIDSIKNYHISKFIGFGIDHTFRAKNSFGNWERVKLQFIIDSTFSKVIGVKDEDEAYKYHSRVFTERQIEEMEIEKKYADWKKQNEDFLIENVKKEDVRTTPSGVQYKIIEEGSGPRPSENGFVKVLTVHRLIDGTIINDNDVYSFDLSKSHSELDAFMICGVGGHYEIYNKPTGHKESGGIPPFSCVIWDVRVLEVR